jgi:hypothetical protein
VKKVERPIVRRKGNESREFGGMIVGFGSEKKDVTVCKRAKRAKSKRETILFEVK